MLGILIPFFYESGFHALKNDEFGFELILEKRVQQVIMAAAFKYPVDFRFVFGVKNGQNIGDLRF